MQMNRDVPVGESGIIQCLGKVRMAPENGVSQPFDPSAISVEKWYPGAALALVEDLAGVSLQALVFLCSSVPFFALKRSVSQHFDRSAISVDSWHPSAAQLPLFHGLLLAFQRLFYWCLFLASR